MKRILIVLIMGPALALVAFLAFITIQTNFFNNSKIKEVSASRFKDERSKELSILQEKGSGAWQEAKLLLIDVRSREEYAKGHIKGAASYPPEKAKKNIIISHDSDVALYSSESGVDTLNDVANTIVVNSQKNDPNISGRVIIIKDSYEVLKESGFKIEETAWD